MPIISIALTALMLLVIVYDARKYLIPNWLCGLVLAVYPALLLMGAPVDWLSGLQALGILFVVGYLMFARGWIGGGDAKLLAACALWVGMKLLPEFVIWTTLLGGVLSLALIMLRKALARRKGLPKIFQKGAPVPYGLAIAVAFLGLLWTGKLPGVPAFF